MIEDEVLFILDEVKQMSVGASEFLLAVDPKRVVPDHSAAAMEADLFGFDF